MAPPIVRKCCCCELKIGTWIVLGVTFVQCIIMAVIGYLTLVSDLSDNNYDDNGSIDNAIRNSTVAPDNKILMEDENDDDQYYEIFVKLVLCASAESLIIPIASVFLIIGMIKRRAKLFLPYLALSMLFNVLAIILIQIILIGVKNFAPVIAKLYNIPQSGGLFVILLVFLLTLSGLFIYMWIVVYSHYCVLKEENARGQYDKQVYRSA